MALIKASGINLRYHKVGEADKIVRVFTKERGKISCIAKGARRPGSKFGGRLEPFAYNEFLLAEGKSLFVLSQVETIESFARFREDPVKLDAAAFFARLIDSSTEEGQKNPELFDLFLKSLQLLKEKIDAPTLKLFFMLNLMETEGFFPHLDGCVKCKKMVTAEPKEVYFNAGLGGIICTPCSGKIPYGKKISYSIVRTMKELLKSGPRELGEMIVSAAAADGIREIIIPSISEHIGKDIRNW